MIGCPTGQLVALTWRAKTERERTQFVDMAWFSVRLKGENLYSAIQLSGRRSVALSGSSRGGLTGVPGYWNMMAALRNFGLRHESDLSYRSASATAPRLPARGFRSGLGS